MRLLTHNLLSSRCVKGVNVGFPLKIALKEMEEVKSDFNPDFISRLIPKVDWNALREAATVVGCAEDLPEKVPTDYENDEEFLRKAHHVLVEVEIIEADLICPETGRKFPIKNGIPNMLVNEDEV